MLISRPLAAALIGGLVLVGCAGTSMTPQARAAVVCSNLESALATVTPYKSEMSDQEVRVVDMVANAANPTCSNLDSATTQGTVDRLRDYLRRLQKLEQRYER